MKALTTAILVCLASNSFAATRNIVPRATGEGGIGTSAKIWNEGYFDDVTTTYGVAAATGTFSGAVGITGAVTSAGQVTGASLKATTGSITLGVLAKAAIIATDPTIAGEVFYCSDCTTVPMCISTGTAATQWSLITDKTAACN